MPEIEITLRIRTSTVTNARFIRNELERLLDEPSNWADAASRSFFESLSQQDGMIGEAKLSKVSVPCHRLL